MAGHALQEVDDGAVAAIGEKGVVPDIDDMLLGDGLDVAEVDEHPSRRRTFGVDDFARQGDFNGVTVAVQVTALAGVVGDAVARVKFKAARNTHGYTGWQKRSRIIRTSFLDLINGMDTPAQMLSVTDHNRIFGAMTYVYPVVSRRAGGVSVGINLNPNTACNWHCAYCQVPGLVRGAAPEIDAALLEGELRGFLDELLHGRFMEERVPPEARRICDIAFSGNGEPTSSKAFAEIVDKVVAVRDAMGLAAVPLRLITNGSLIDRPYVQTALRLLAAAGGEVWFKLDAGTAADIERINGIDVDPQTHARRLALCASLCPTWVQTCLFRWDGQLPSREQIERYLDMLDYAGIEPLKGIMLYGVARQSFQPEAIHLQQLTPGELEEIAVLVRERVMKKGLTVKVSP